MGWASGPSAWSVLYAWSEASLMRIRGKDELGERPSNVSPVLPQLWRLDEVEERTQATRVGPAWRHAISEPDTMESERPPNFEDDVSRALDEFRAEQRRRNRNMVPVMFVMGCAVGILVAIVPSSRLFRSHFARAAAAAAVVAAAPSSPTPEVQSPVATSAIEPAATPAAPIPAVVASPPPPFAAKHARARAASSRAAPPAPGARSSSNRAKSSADNEDDDVVKNAHAADDLAAAQLTDAL